MKYIVEVGEPVPSNLDEIASKVAASFNISDAKAMALLRRAPGAMTKAVSEREASVVAGIFERAGLNVVKRPAENGAVAATGEGAGDRSGTAASTAEGMPPARRPGMEGGEAAAHGAEVDFDSGAEGSAARGAHPPRRDDGDVWDQPLGATEHEPVDSFSRRDDFDDAAADIGWEGDAWGSSSTGPASPGAEAGVPAMPPGPPAGRGVSDADEDISVEMGTPPEQHPATGRAAEAVPEPAAPGAGEPGPDSGKERRVGGRRRERRARPQRESAEPAPRRREAAARSAERGADEVRAGRGGVSRDIVWAGVLPPLLSLLAMGVAMLVMLVPVAREQQAAQAADTAGSQAAALEALTGGLPLTAQSLESALTVLSNNSQALLRPHGVSLLVVTDTNGVPLAGWYGPAKTPAAMPPATRQAVSSSALTALSGQPQVLATTFGQRLKDSWHVVQAMAGQRSEATVLRAAPVVSAGQSIGSVVVGVPPVSGQTSLVAAFETVLLVGLIPLLIGILIAMGINSGMRRKVRYLLQAADRISRGELDEPVTLRGRDAFGQLGRAIERMRVSLSTLLEHRRRHR